MTTSSGPVDASDEPTVSGFPGMSGYPSWLTWTARDKSWEVSYGDDGCGILDGGWSGEQVVSVSAGPNAGARWFYTDDPRGLAAALLAAADRADADHASGSKAAER